CLGTLATAPALPQLTSTFAHAAGVRRLNGRALANARPRRIRSHLYALVRTWLNVSQHAWHKHLRHVFPKVGCSIPECGFAIYGDAPRCTAIPAQRPNFSAQTAIEALFRKPR